MTALAHPTALPRGPVPLIPAAAGFAFATLVAIVLMQLLPGTLDGEPIWLKPVKFGVALTLFLATLHWAITLMPMRHQTSRWTRGWAWTAIAAASAELAWIFTAAGFGTRSHYNVTEPWLQMLYQTAMGPIAVVLTLSAAALGLPLLRHGWGEVERAMGWGLIATTALTIPVALQLAAGPVEGAGLPPFGWTFAPGDLRPAHFLATHAMQAVPVAALALSRLGTLPYGTGRALAIAWALPTLAAAAYGMGWL